MILHCDGAVYELVDRFIGMGIDALNPVEPTVNGMEHHRLKKTFGDRICFHGGIQYNVPPENILEMYEAGKRHSSRGTESSEDFNYAGKN